MYLQNAKYKCIKLMFFIVISFLFGCMVAINLYPIEKTCRLDLDDRAYNIMRNSKLPSPELIILILSAPKNADRRNVLRKTWLQLRPKDFSFHLKHYFVIGSMGLEIDDVLHLSDEQSQFNDILLVPITDTYENLTLKVSKSFSWLEEQTEVGLDFKYVLKCDDDSFVRLDNLGSELKAFDILYQKSVMEDSLFKNNPFIRHNLQNNDDVNVQMKDLAIYWGYFDGRASIKKTGKWAEKKYILCDKYLPYALGGGYILSKRLVLYLGRNADYLRMFHSEDISVGTWLAPVNNVLRIHDIRFDTEWKSRGCKNYFLVTHSHTIKEISTLYNRIKETGNLCATEEINRSYWWYNWNMPPSQCCNTNTKKRN